MGEHLKVDLKREIEAYRAQAGEFRILEMPVLRYLMIDGSGDPNDPAGEYAAALGALFPLAYRLKFASKRELGRDYTVMPLEALWWADDLAGFTERRDKTTWRWTAMILTPDWVPDDLVARCTEEVAAASAPPAIDRVRLATLEEGLVMQTLHIGPYDAEGPTLARMHEELIPDAGLTETGHHHEIYLSDARRVAPEKLRTILRQPVVAR